MTQQKSDLYRAATDWTYDIYHSHTLWLRRVLLLTISLLILLLISMVSNLFLFPLKEKVPYLYAFDHATGEITTIGVLEPTKLSSNWALSRYLLMQYVNHRESYDFDNIDLPYQMVWAQSADDVRKRYEDAVNSSNVNSPYKMYGKDKFITVHVISINRLNDNTADIKFEKRLCDRSSDVLHIIHQEAIVKWTFNTAITTQEMLDRDPLGFKVTYYQVSQVNIDHSEGEVA